MMKKSSVSRTRRFTYFQILCYALERWIRTQHQILFGNDSWVGSRVHHNTELWTQLMVSRWNSSGMFPRIHHIKALQQSPRVHVKMSDPSEEFKGRIIFMSMFNDISWRSEDNEQECNANADLVSIFARRFPPGRWWFLRLGSKKKWYSTHVSRPQGDWDRVAELMMIHFGDSGHPVFRSTSPLSRWTLKGKGGGKLSIHFCAAGETIENFFSHNYFCQSAQSSLRFVWRTQKTFHVRTGRPVEAVNTTPHSIDETYSLTQTVPIKSGTFEQFKDVQQVISLIRHWETMYCYLKDLLCTSATSGIQVKWIS